MVSLSNLFLDPTLALIRAQLGFRIQVRAECGKKIMVEILATNGVASRPPNGN